MKLLFSADWHINLVKKNVPKEWQRKRYLKMFDKLHQLSKDVDMAVLGGDLFDKHPNTEEIGLYFDAISGFECPTFIFDGNHEATKKGETFLHHLKNATDKINKNAHIVTEPTEVHHIDIIPYTHIKTFDPKKFHNKILCTHVRGNIAPHVKEEINLEKLSRWDVVLAGDLHSYSNSQTGGSAGKEYNILYPGSPLTISFHRNKVSTGVIILDTDTLEHEWVELELPQMVRKTVESPDDMVETKYDHTIYELVGNVSELSNLEIDSNLLDKKIIDKNYSSTLDLIGLSIEEELVKYLTDIVKLDQKELEGVLSEYHDCT